MYMGIYITVSSTLFFHIPFRSAFAWICMNTCTMYTHTQTCICECSQIYTYPNTYKLYVLLIFDEVRRVAEPRFVSSIHTPNKRVV